MNEKLYKNISLSEINVFIDMDGVLAEYKRGPVEQYLQPGFFLDLKPDREAIELAQSLLNMGLRVFSFTTLLLGGSNDPRKEKGQWLLKNMPQLYPPLTVPIGIGKHELLKELFEIKENPPILIDDFHVNLKGWEDAGGVAIRYLNGINNPDSPNWKGMQVSNERDLLPIFRKLCII